MNKWHVWTIISQRNKKVIEFLSELSNIDSYLYPTIEKTYDTKSGKRVKNIPLYNNYIFIKYEHNNYMLNEIGKCQWIKEYVGVCSDKEIVNIERLSEEKYEDIIVHKRKVEKGVSYKLKETPFKDMMCTVVEVNNDKLVVAVELFGSDRLIKCSIDDIYLEG